KGLKSVKNNFAEAIIDGQSYFFDPNIVPANPPQAFLLPAFDEYIIAYRDRSAVITSEQSAKAISSNGIFRPTIVVDGKVIGLWRKTSLKSRPLSLEYFEQPASSTQKMVENAAERLKKCYLCG
ncbi:MAG: winged helix DNA-binding domain-containing protein, partial [Dysgonamonadaceae bacterium]|nr:winged helix DNA-binding domain-containing protein [Dysgonamonadaceae bacterium]